MTEGLRIDSQVLEEGRIRARMNEIWAQLAGARILEDDEAIELSREYRELEERLKGVA